MRKSRFKVVTGSNFQHHLRSLGSIPCSEIDFNIFIFSLKFTDNNKYWIVTDLVSSYHRFSYTPVSQSLSYSHKLYLSPYSVLLIFVLQIIRYIILTCHKCIVKVIDLRYVMFNNEHI